MTTAVVVQARYGSLRLPGKVLLEFGGKTVLQHVLERCQAVPGADLVVCAVPDKADSRPLEDVAAACGVIVFRGPEEDVLGRYYGAATEVHAGVVLRVTSDCPLIDPIICGRVLSLRQQSNADYAANNMPPSFPHGLDCEAFLAGALGEAAAAAKTADEREHVTPWLRHAAHLKRCNLSSGNPALAAHRWTLDYPEDIAFFKALAEKLGDIKNAHMRDVLDVIERHPEIAEINAGRVADRRNNANR